MSKDGRSGPVSNQSEEWQRVFAGKMAEYSAKKPVNYVHPTILTFLLMGRPAGCEGAASMQSGKCILDAEKATSTNPTGTYKVGASLEILKSRGFLSRQKKKLSTDVKEQ